MGRAPLCFDHRLSSTVFTGGYKTLQLSLFKDMMLDKNIRVRTSVCGSDCYIYNFCLTTIFFRCTQKSLGSHFG